MAVDDEHDRIYRLKNKIEYTGSSAKESCKSTTQHYQSAKQPCISAKEPCISEKEPCVWQKTLNKIEYAG